jgi:hypothetical protein
MWDSYINVNRDDSGVGGGNEIDGDIKWPEVRVVWEVLSRLVLNIMFHMD